MTLIAVAILLLLMLATATGVGLAIAFPKYRLVASLFSAFTFLLAAGLVLGVILLIRQM